MTRLDSMRGFALFSLCAAFATLHGCAPGAQAPADPTSYTLETLVPGIPFHGIHGLTFDSEGHLFVGSVVGQSTYRVDPESGEISLAVGPPDGCADDMEFGPDGRRY